MSVRQFTSIKCHDINFHNQTIAILDNAYTCIYEYDYQSSVIYEHILIANQNEFVFKYTGQL